MRAVLYGEPTHGETTYIDGPVEVVIPSLTAVQADLMARITDDARSDEPWLPATWHQETLDDAYYEQVERDIAAVEELRTA